MCINLPGKVGFGTAPLGNMFRDIPPLAWPNCVWAKRWPRIRAMNMC